MKKIFIGLAVMFISISSFAGLPEMMKIYKNPKSAPKISACKGDTYCNGFIALSKQWKDIPNSYRYKGEYDIKAYARDGSTYDEQGRNQGLESGFYWSTEKSNSFIRSLDNYIETKGHIPDSHEGGLAVLLYIEDKNGWVENF